MVEVPKDPSLGPRTVEGARYLWNQVEFYIQFSGWDDQKAVEYLRGLRTEAHLAMRSPLARRVEQCTTGAELLFGKIADLRHAGIDPQEALFTATLYVSERLGMDEDLVVFYYHTRGDAVLPGDRRQTPEDWLKEESS